MTNIELPAHPIAQQPPYTAAYEDGRIVINSPCQQLHVLAQALCPGTTVVEVWGTDAEGRRRNGYLGLADLETVQGETIPTLVVVLDDQPDCYEAYLVDRDKDQAEVNPRYWTAPLAVRLMSLAQWGWLREQAWRIPVTEEAWAEVRWEAHKALTRALEALGQVEPPADVI